MGAITLTWYGHSNFKIEADGTTVVVDPFFEGNPNAPEWTGAIDKADLVLVTHDHGDHVGQALDISKATGAKVVGVFDTIGALAAQGLPEDKGVGMNIGGTVRHAGLAVHMVQAMHSTATGVATGYIITTPGGFTLYHSGDTGLFASMGLFRELHDMDLALLPIDGHFNMDARQAAIACRLLGCRQVVPMHWGTFPILAQSTKDFEQEVASKAPHCLVVPMKPGETREFNGL